MLLTKMILAVIQERDLAPVLDAFRAHRLGMTQIGSTGGFLRQGNVSLIVGVRDDRVDEVTSIFRRHCRRRTELQMVPAPARGCLPAATSSYEVEVGGAVIFVLDLCELEEPV